MSGDAPPEVIEQIRRLHREEDHRHRRVTAMIEDIEQAMGRTVRKVREEAIVVISKNDADRWETSTTVDVFKYLYSDMKKRGRPYIKCVEWYYGRIFMWVPTGPYTEGLVNQLLFVAYVNYPGMLPTLTIRKSPPTNGKLQVWKSPKFILFDFYGGEGEKLFKNWKEFVTTDKASRIRLGLKGETDNG